MPEYPQRGVAVVQLADLGAGGAWRLYCPLRVGLHPSRTALELAGRCAAEVALPLKVIDARWSVTPYESIAGTVLPAGGSWHMVCAKAGDHGNRASAHRVTLRATLTIFALEKVTYQLDFTGAGCRSRTRDLLITKHSWFLCGSMPLRAD